MYILDNLTNTLIEAEIVMGSAGGVPLKKHGWKFNWRSTLKTQNAETFILRLTSNPTEIQGALHLKIRDNMLIMDLIEIAPHNIGQGTKRYSYVAGCLIAFACRESFKLESNYKGFLTFESKTALISWYMEKYYAKVAIGQKMFIEPENGKQLIKTFLKRTKRK